MRAEFGEVWMETEVARTLVRDALAGGSAFCVLRKACRKLREVEQAAKLRYLEVYICL